MNYKKFRELMNEFNCTGECNDTRFIFKPSANNKFIMTYYSPNDDAITVIMSGIFPDILCPKWLADPDFELIPSDGNNGNKKSFIVRSLFRLKLFLEEATAYFENDY